MKQMSSCHAHHQHRTPFDPCLCFGRHGAGYGPLVQVELIGGMPYPPPLTTSVKLHSTGPNAGFPLGSLTSHSMLSSSEPVTPSAQRYVTPLIVPWALAAVISTPEHRMYPVPRFTATPTAISGGTLPGPAGFGTLPRQAPLPGAVSVPPLHATLRFTPPKLVSVPCLSIFT
jgi:hypothetical protein